MTPLDVPTIVTVDDWVRRGTTVLAMQDLIATVDEARSRHRPEPLDAPVVTDSLLRANVLWCAICRRSWPCDVDRIIERVDRLGALFRGGDVD